MHGRTRRPTRALAVAAVCAAVAIPAFTASPAAAAEPSTTDPIAGAAGWLGRQFEQGGLPDGFGGTDFGNTIDASFSLAATGYGRDLVSAFVDRLAADPLAYTGFGDPDEAYAGATAKAALFLTAAERPEADALVTQLESLRCGSDARPVVDVVPCTTGNEGRYSDVSEYGDFSSPITQSLAILALVRSGADVPPDAVALLESAQCADGGFAQSFGASPCTSDIDYSGISVAALAAAEADTTEGVQYLLDARDDASGLWVGEGVPNANSSAFAVQGLDAAGSDLGDALGSILALQVPASGAEAERGAITYDGTFAANAARATAQALLIVAGGSYASTTIDLDAMSVDLPVLSEPASTPASTSTPTDPATTPSPAPSSLPVSLSSSTVAPGGVLTVTAQGFVPGEAVTATVFSTPTRVGAFTADSSGVVTARVRIPSDTSPGEHRLELRGASGRVATVSFTVVLPATGANADLGLAALTGVTLVGAGGALLVLARRRGAHEA